MFDTATKRKITYKVMRVLPTSTVSYLVWECEDGAAVNEYVAYEKRGARDLLVLYPNRKLMPSSLTMQKRTISIHDTKRGF